MATGPVRADDDDYGGGWRRHHWQEHQWREQRWREHEWRERALHTYAPPPYGYAPPPAYGYAQPWHNAWDSAREEWHRARRAEDMARWRAEDGDYEGANRTQFWADRHRERAR
jgi:hypothetical protein